MGIAQLIDYWHGKFTLTGKIQLNKANSANRHQNKKNKHMNEAKQNFH